jgi:hypothetical protein
MNCLNRHDAWTELMGAWQATGNPIYPAFFDALVQDWTLHLPCRANVSHAGWNSSGSYAAPCATGTTEIPLARFGRLGIRMQGPWPAVCYGFQMAPGILRLRPCAAAARSVGTCRRFVWPQTSG